MSSLSPAGGDSCLTFKYAVRKRSVDRSSKADSLSAAGAGVCEGDEDAAQGSDTSLLAHCMEGIGQMRRPRTSIRETYELHPEPRPQRDARGHRVARGDVAVVVVVGHVDRLQEHLQRERDVVRQVRRLRELQEVGRVLGREQERVGEGLERVGVSAAWRSVRPRERGTGDGERTVDMTCRCRRARSSRRLRCRTCRAWRRALPLPGRPCLFDEGRAPCAAMQPRAYASAGRSHLSDITHRGRGVLLQQLIVVAQHGLRLLRGLQSNAGEDVDTGGVGELV